MTAYCFRTATKLLILLLSVAAVTAYVGSHAHFADDEGLDEGAKISVGILRRAKSCTPAEKISMHAVVTVSMRLFTDESKEKRVEVFHSDNKVIPGVGKMTTISGLEMGILGACVGEVRSIRIPAELGFGQLGHKKLNVPSEMPLRAKVEIKSFQARSSEDDEAEAIHPDPDFSEDITEANHMTGAARPEPKDMPFPDEVKQLTDSTFDGAVKGKDAFVMIHAPWCPHCISFKPAFAKVAKAFASETDVAMVAVNGEANSGITSQFNVKGYPTIFLLKASGAKVPYEGNRDAKSVVAFLNKELNKNVASTA